MTGLGYERFGTQGGDWGAVVSTWLAYLFPDHVTGLHLNFIPSAYRPPLGEGQPPLSADEDAFLKAASAWFDAEGAYAHIQSTKPQTATYGLADSPAAWPGGSSRKCENGAIATAPWNECSHWTKS
jgi:pimeloyl-ACP methyl ester carboxylesterase